ncbi:C-type lectin [Aphelenchoides avenae]|nr:C-type lectin [Aphelenchus avenae]
MRNALTVFVVAVAVNAGVSLPRGQSVVLDDDPAPPLGDPSVGTPCSSYTNGTSLEIQLLFDTGISSDTLGTLGPVFTAFMAPYSFGATGRASCVGLSTVTGSNVKDISKLSDCAGMDVLMMALLMLGSSADPSSPPVELLETLQQVQKNYAQRASSRPKLLVIALQSASTKNVDKAEQLATELRKQGTFIAFITADSGDSSLSPLLSSMASPGQVFNATDQRFYLIFSFAGCRCPHGTTQLVVEHEDDWGTVFYGDCFKPVSKLASQSDAEKACEADSGTLVSVTSKQKLNFIQKNVVVPSFSGLPEYWLGLHKINVMTLAWYFYGGQLLPVGNFTPGLDPMSTGDCGYVRRSTGFNVEFALGPCDTSRLSVCQIRACDSQHYCPNWRP